MNEHNKWNEIKKNLECKQKIQSFKNRDIFWLHIGKNIGFETFGKGEEFLRPVLIFKKFSQYTFLGIPLTTTTKNDIFHYKFTVKKTNKVNYASLSQLKIFDAKRLQNKLDKMSTEDFKNLKISLKRILDI